MDHEDAKKIVEAFQKASALCNDSLKTVKVHDSLGQTKVFARLAGAFLGQAYTNVLAPLWKTFPDLEPPEIREARTEPPPQLSPASERAVRSFLEQAHAAIRMLEIMVPQGERDAAFAFGGVPEVQSAVAQIERFLASPVHHE